MAAAPKGRPFKPGQSGNPAGRPKGTGEPARLRAAIAEHVPDIIDRLVTLARDGDVQAARLLLERVCAPLKASEAPVLLPLPADVALPDAGRSVLAALAGGILAPGQAAAVLGALASQAKLIEADELEARITALERQAGVA